jgi:CDP-4-dehydro-6-deoxyglucose reductase, E3
MPKLQYGERIIVMHPKESVLEALLRSEIKVPHSCRAGSCQACVLRSNGAPPAASQLGLREGQRQQNYFFACLCRPEEDLSIDLEANHKEQEVTIQERVLLGPRVLGLKLKTSEHFPYHAGQFIQLRREDGLTRSYSLASLPEDEALALHIRLIPDGQMSQWLAKEALSIEPLYLRGPCGDCFYTAGKPEQPLLLLGTGTGLAPLYGILRDALRAGHYGPIQLIHGAMNQEDLYLQEPLQHLVQTYSNFSYEPCALRGEPTQGLYVGDLRQLVKERFKSLRGWRAFICGDPELVNALKKWAFLAGASMKEIFADAFVMSPAPSQPASL